MVFRKQIGMLSVNWISGYINFLTFRLQARVGRLVTPEQTGTILRTMN